MNKSSTLLVVSDVSCGCCQNEEHHIRALLVAPSKEGLEQTKAQTMVQPQDTVEHEISLHVMDLSQLEETSEQNVQKLIAAAELLRQYESIVVINNAGSVGHLEDVIS